MFKFKKRDPSHKRSSYNQCTIRDVLVVFNFNLPQTVSTMSIFELSKCCCLNSIWRLSTHHTYLESVRHIMLLVSGCGVHSTFKKFFVVDDMITRLQSKVHQNLFKPLCVLTNHAAIWCLLCQDQNFHDRSFAHQFWRSLSSRVQTTA